MVRRVALFLFSAAVAAQAGIDFTPMPFFVEFEGIRVQQPGFRNGDAMVTFAPPTGWALEGAGTTLTLIPKEFSAATARVETRAVTGTPVDSEENLKSARDRVAMLLPKEAQGLAWAPEVEHNPVLLNRHETVRMEASYAVSGQAWRVGVILCNLADQQLCFILSGPERAFPKLYEPWRRSLYTWQGLK